MSPTAYWKSVLLDASKNFQRDDPNYFAADPTALVTTSTAHNFVLGTGADIFDAIAPYIEAAEHEVIFVTCFWAKSNSQEKLSHALRMLSRKAEILGATIRVRIAFSSLSLIQKLFHTTSLDGQIWPKDKWTSHLYLPPPQELPGLDLQIKSIFVLPFSVMHPKYVIIDRKTAWLPSCNVSWESWFEGGIELSGPVVQQFVQFYQSFWARKDPLPDIMPGESGQLDLPRQIPEFTSQEHLHPKFCHRRVTDTRSMLTVFLPSPHRRNPSWSPFTEQAVTPYPETPLNRFLLRLLEKASKDIYIQTPNLTSPPVLSALLATLVRGVNVTIVTSARLMILEQIVTAGTTTKRCLKKLVKRYKAHQAAYSQRDPEAGLKIPGTLEIWFFKPGSAIDAQRNVPVQSHIKCTIVDKEWVILGSGNMDRASWYTSQELGVAFQSPALASEVWSALHATNMLDT
ncbi:phospholipase D/nuclease [Pseudovirgaria hyperparasitica]|uniref:Phospholipase D/nuclease n=1 Tax=Pseudovirgaria hyperparasitica TaxID=470096 RepID=A0A6A6W538_9PEZI|nr:phospholipase D/nuclease [Pseudovirgaria hyperparasitica]KAF2757665.1 phospholipase D/nuclease [Pseudovirgaria hyperparasitica]